MKKFAAVLVCVVALTAGCGGKGSTAPEEKPVKSSSLTQEQKKLIASLCGDASNDGDLRIKDSFEDTGCYSA